MPLPDRLLTLGEAGKVLGEEEKTVRKHVDDGELPYIALGRGLRRIRRMIHPDDLATFIEHRRRTAATCPSTSLKARPSTTMISKSNVVAFTDQLAAERSRKPKTWNDTGATRRKRL